MNRGRGLAIIGLLVGSGLALMCYLPVWVSFVHGQSDIFKTASTVTGRDYSPAAFSLGLVVLAGSVVVWALPGVWVRVAGVVLTLASGYMVAVPLLFRSDPQAAAAGALLRKAGRSDGGFFVMPLSVSWWWVPALLGALLAFAASLLAVFHRGRWGGFSARYERPAGDRPPTAQATRSATWDALDRGDDPTVALDEGAAAADDPPSDTAPAAG